MDEARCTVRLWEGDLTTNGHLVHCDLLLEPGEGPCQTCGHPRGEHGQERKFYDCGGSRRELCLLCPGYVMADEVTTGYPRGEAWHRYKPPSPHCPVHGARAEKEVRA